MCGVIGVQLNNVENFDLEIVRTLFNKTMIRGKHAAGLTYLKNNELVTHKKNVPASAFIDEIDFGEFVDNDGTLNLIGHIRYSTSDLRYPQPFSSDEYSIVHNGVISQEHPSTWKYKTETSNDSELILRSIEHNMDPLTDFRPSSMAVVTLSLAGRMVGFRNEARPLWHTKLSNGVIFTSTKDIATRSGLTGSERCDMYKLYTCEAGLVTINDIEGVPDVKDLQP